MSYFNLENLSAKNGVIFMIFNFLFCTLSCNAPNSTLQEQSVKNEQYVNIYGRYLANTNSWKVEASFFSADTTKPQKTIAVDGSVYFQDNKMMLKQIKGFDPKYTFQGSTPFEENHVVKLIRNNKKESTFSLAMSPIGKYGPVGNISKSKGFNLTWEGKPLTKNETLVILLTDSKGNTQTMNRLGPSKTNTIEVIPPQLKKVEPGKGTMSVVKKSRNTFNQTGQPKASFVLEYYQDSIDILVEK